MFTLPHIPDKYISSWAQYSILLPKEMKRKTIINRLDKKSIPTMVYYKIPAHLQVGYKQYDYNLGDFPKSEEISNHILSIPMHPYLKKNNQDKIIEAINDLI